MAGFKTHVTFSSTIGVAYGGVALYQGVPLPTCVLAAGLCGVSGMLPDLDSDSGRPLRESVTFAAAVVPMMLVGRMERMEWSMESIVLAGAFIYLGIRWGLAWVLKKFSVHRGMFHSIPAMLIFGEIAFLLVESPDMKIRYYKAGAVMAGYLSHLVLDEIWSIDFRRFRLKSSFGTALKLWGDNGWANFSTYAKLAVLTYVSINDPMWMYNLHHNPHSEALQEIAGSEPENIAR
ncbi:MAG: metal-dependent hydrolase [Pirellulales bacterium]|nr:metal-dependent hydrolase [Pirellulales bacterium]